MRLIDRRRFLKILGAFGVSLSLGSCQPKLESGVPDATPSEFSAGTTPARSGTQTGTSARMPAASPTGAAPQTVVAIGRSAAYDLATLRTALERMVSDAGGIKTLVGGARVGIKVNLTGGTGWDSPARPPATEFFVTHPAVVESLCLLLLDQGAREITIMDGLGDAALFEKWGYAAFAKKLGAALVDLCRPDPYPSYQSFPVGKSHLVYEQFQLNRILGQLDAFISVGKMKCHTTTGVTLSLKNLIGLAPISAYRLRIEDNHRSALHGDIRFDRRLPRVILDLNRARPIDLALIDGIKTAEGGAGPWDARLSPVSPGLLFLGKDPVATDAVATAVMGFDPCASDGSAPFLGGENHLNLARAHGLGTNRLEEITVAGFGIAEIQQHFLPAR